MEWQKKCGQPDAYSGEPSLSCKAWVWVLLWLLFCFFVLVELKDQLKSILLMAPSWCFRLRLIPSYKASDNVGSLPSRLADHPLFPAVKSLMRLRALYFGFSDQSPCEASVQLELACWPSALPAGQESSLSAPSTWFSQGLVIGGILHDISALSFHFLYCFKIILMFSS